MKTPSSIGIIGGGLCGLSCALNLKQLLTDTRLIIYDFATNTPTSRSMNENTASVAAAGLMHPFSPSGSLMWHGLECYEESLSLVHLVERTTGKKLYNRDTKIIRPALEEKDVLKLQKTATQYPDLCSYYNKDDGLLKFGPTVFRPSWKGIAQYESSIVLDTVSYLSSLWSTIMTLCTRVEWKSQMIETHDIEKLKLEHDVLIFAGMYSVKRPQSPFFLSLLCFRLFLFPVFTWVFVVFNSCQLITGNI